MKEKVYRREYLNQLIPIRIKSKMFPFANCGFLPFGRNSNKVSKNS